VTATLGGMALDSTDDRRLHLLGTSTSRASVHVSIADDVHADEVVDELELALVAARGGDENGFAVLWRDLHPRLVRYLRVRGDDAAEDLAAETWMHVVRGLPTFEGEMADFRGWLFTIARHRAIDRGRAFSRGLSTISVAEPGEVANRVSTVQSAEDDAADNAATAEALRLVATLPPAQAEMVMLRVVAGLDVAEVARIVDKRPGAVRVGVHRALKTLSRTAGLVENETDIEKEVGHDERGIR
jgi:RNA polymerase sigma-70 factor (ECF subfamily)